jgi:hypothetical protein
LVGDAQRVVVAFTLADDASVLLTPSRSSGWSSITTILMAVFMG